MNDFLKTLKESFQNKEYRHGYVDEFLNTSIATQIKVLREQRGWSQKELADHAGMLQPRISVMENVNYSSWSIKILREIAEAFDLTLCVSFESFGKRVDDIEKFSRKALERNSFEDDPYFKDKEKDMVDGLLTFMEIKFPEQAGHKQFGQAIDFIAQYTKESSIQKTLKSVLNKKSDPLPTTGIPSAMQGKPKINDEFDSRAILPEPWVIGMIGHSQELETAR